MKKILKIKLLNKYLLGSYKFLELSERHRQNFIFDGKIISVGIPNKVF